MSSKRWTLLSQHNASTLDLPMASAGHTAHVIGNEMHILFGYNPFEGYLFTPQIYSFGHFNSIFIVMDQPISETGTWRRGIVDPLVQGRFGHVSVLFTELNQEQMILVHGGYNAPINSYSYSINDELLLYDPNRQTWFGKYNIYRIC